MKIGAFVLMLLLYGFACYCGALMYLTVAAAIRKSIPNRFAMYVLLYGWFLIFLAIEVPIGIFFPAWLSERLEIFPRESLTTALLILLGCGTLATVVWNGWRRKGHATR